MSLMKPDYQNPSFNAVLSRSFMRRKQKSGTSKGFLKSNGCSKALITAIFRL